MPAAAKAADVGGKAIKKPIPSKKTGKMPLEKASSKPKKARKPRAKNKAKVVSVATADRGQEAVATPSGSKATAGAGGKADAWPAASRDVALAAAAAKVAAEAPPPDRAALTGRGTYVYTYGALPCAANAAMLAQAILGLLAPAAVADEPGAAGSSAVAADGDGADGMAHQGDGGEHAPAEAMAGVAGPSSDVDMPPPAAATEEDAGAAAVPSPDGNGRDSFGRSRRVRRDSGGDHASLTPDDGTGLPAHLGAAAQRVSPLLQEERLPEPPPPRRLHVLVLTHSLALPAGALASLGRLLHPPLAELPPPGAGGSAGESPGSAVRRTARRGQQSRKALECDIHSGLPGASSARWGGSAGDATQGLQQDDDDAGRAMAAGVDALRRALSPQDSATPLGGSRKRPASAAASPLKAQRAAVRASPGAATRTLAPVEVELVRVLSLGRQPLANKDAAYELLNAAADAIHESALAGAALLVCCEPSHAMLRQLAKADSKTPESKTPNAKTANAHGVAAAPHAAGGGKAAAGGKAAEAMAKAAERPTTPAARLRTAPADSSDEEEAFEVSKKAANEGGAFEVSKKAAMPPSGPANPKAGAAPPQLDGWARACAAAYCVRWRGVPASEAAGGLAKAGPLRPLVRGYFPALFSICLFELDRSSQFHYYASSTVAFVQGKLRQFGGCEFELHLNAAAAAHGGLLRALIEAARGRIAFREYAFVPRPKVAPWLLAAMRLASLLEHADGRGGGRTVVTMDVHDDAKLQDAQLRALHARLWRERKDLCITWWLADEGAADCLVGAPLPVPRLKACVPDPAYHSNGANGGLGLHAHMDAGLMVAQGSALRTALLRAHGGVPFKEYLRQYVLNAPSIPHGIEEMAWDHYFRASWETLLPLTLFSVHRSLIAGRDTADPFPDVTKDAQGVPVPSAEAAGAAAAGAAGVKEAALKVVAAKEAGAREAVTKVAAAKEVETKKAAARAAAVKEAAAGGAPAAAPPAAPPQTVRLAREDFDIGRAIFGNSLACCRHSQVLDCALDSERTRAAGGKAVGQRVFVPRFKGGASDDESESDEVEMCLACGRDEVDMQGDALLLCDGTATDGEPCPRTCHQACCSPPVTTVPEGDWFCPGCEAARAAKAAVAADASSADA